MDQECTDLRWLVKRLQIAIGPTLGRFCRHRRKEGQRRMDATLFSRTKSLLQMQEREKKLLTWLIRLSCARWRWTLMPHLLFMNNELMVMITSDSELRLVLCQSWFLRRRWDQTWRSQHALNIKLNESFVSNSYLSTSKIFSIEVGTIKGEVILFSTARTHPKENFDTDAKLIEYSPSFVWMPIAVEPSLIASIAYSTCTRTV